MTATIAASVGSLHALREFEGDAWDAYARACHDPFASDEQRAVLFQAAVVTMTAVINEERGLKGLAPIV